MFLIPLPWNCDLPPWVRNPSGHTKKRPQKQKNCNEMCTVLMILYTILSFCCYITVLISIKYYYIVPILWLDYYVTLVSNLLYCLITMVLCYSIPMSLCYSITLLHQDVSISYHYITPKPYHNMKSATSLVTPRPATWCCDPRAIDWPSAAPAAPPRRDRHRRRLSGGRLGLRSKPSAGWWIKCR